MALVALRRPDERSAALRDAFAELLSTNDARRGFAATMCGLDIRHDLGDGHPLLGRRMPDLDLATVDGPLRVFELLHAARPVLLNFGPPGRLDIGGRVRQVDATSAGPWELPLVGMVDAPGAVLIRPDGHVAWVGGADGRGLDDALATWCGAR